MKSEKYLTEKKAIDKMYETGFCDRCNTPSENTIDGHGECYDWQLIDDEIERPEINSHE